MGCSSSAPKADSPTLPLAPGSTKAKPGPAAGDVDDDEEPELFEAATEATSPEPRDMDDALFEMLVGGQQAAQQRSPPRKQQLSTERRPAETAPSTPPKRGQAGARLPSHTSQASPAVVRAAARAGVPVPLATDEDEEYGHIDNYVDDLLGVPIKERPEEWRQKTAQASEAALSAEMPSIIYADGKRGPPQQPKPQKERLQEQEPVLMSYPDPKQFDGKVTPYLGGVLSGWASVDKPALEQSIAERGPDAAGEAQPLIAPGGEGPKPKAKAKQRVSKPNQA